MGWIYADNALLGATAITGHLTATGGATFASSVTVTGAGQFGGSVKITKNATGETTLIVKSTFTTSNSAVGIYLLGDDEAYLKYGQFTHFNAGYTTNGLLAANRQWINNTGGDILMGTSGANDVIFHTNGIAAGNEAMRIASGGAVTIPGSAFSVGGSTLVVANGNVSIGALGAADIVYRLSVLNSIFATENGAAGRGGLFNYSDSGNTSVNIANTYDGAAATMNFKMRTMGTPVTAMTILGSGNVGIGDTAPQAKMVVNGNIVSSGTLYAQGDLSNFGTFRSSSTKDNDWQAIIDNGQRTAGRSFGLKINGGTNSTDVSFMANTAAGVTLFQVTGAGATTGGALCLTLLSNSPSVPPPWMPRATVLAPSCC